MMDHLGSGWIPVQQAAASDCPHLPLLRPSLTLHVPHRPGWGTNPPARTLARTRQSRVKQSKNLKETNTFGRVEGWN